MRSLLLITLLVACGQPDGGPETPSEAAPEPEQRSSSVVSEAEPGMRPQLVILGSQRVPVEVGSAEDGLGKEIPATAPIAVEIEAERWGGRALDPVLLVDDRAFHHYSHPGPGLIRYVLADEAWLDQASEMAIRYQDPEGRGDEAIPLALPPRLDP
jgi:hypothetical protein